MNTLNNIHALIDINAEEAKSAVIRLSKMMRYLLPESDTKESTLAQEVEFIGSYIRLMKLRLSERVKITVDLPERLPDKPVHPFLFIPFVENAFKYGISYKETSFIHVSMVAGDNRLLFTVKNSKPGGRSPGGYSGTTVDIIRKRLRLLYGSDYNLDIIENAENFTVNLSIPI
jgi:LytS/YehU family sensor histidine kinase